MGLSIYKPGQGYTTRMVSAIGAGTVVLSGVAWLWGELQVIQDPKTRVITQTCTTVGVILLCGALLWYLFNKPRIVDFMIATQAEMRKVNWPSRREVFLSTWIVICGTFLIALLLWVFDIVFTLLFQEMGVLAGGA